MRHRSPRSLLRAPASVLLALVGALSSLCACDESLMSLPPGALVPVVPFSVALAGADLVVIEGQRVQLSGASSRGDSGPVRLVWTQVEGPPVSLTNPSAATPSFIAPLSPAALVFSLQAEGSAVDVDTVRVTVGTVAQPPVGYVVVPPDTTGTPGERVSFDVELAEADGDASLSVRTTCGEPSSVTVDARTITVTLPEALPCALIVDALADNGRGLAPAARVFWPAGTALPAPTRFVAGSVAVAPAASVVLSFDGLAAEDRPLAFGANGGTALEQPVDSDVVVFTVPRRRGRIVIGGEVRRGGVSGGVQYAVIDVGSGSGNAAPLGRGGPDRIVLPGARFRFDTGASFDADGDELLITASQVIGVPAEADIAASLVFIAPDVEGTLLFHVVADDGTVLSEPDPVRVVVDDAAENLRPVLTLAPERYVRPGEMFLIDASGAQDPDSGFINGFLIQQADDDPVRLLGEPLTTPTASFVAQQAGDIYNFRVTAFDEGGLGTTAEVAVIVEDAGPYVDPVRGDDALGNGTADAPFATITGALPTAARHAFDALLLAEGAHAAPPALLPPSLDLIGQHRFTDGTYAREPDATTTLPIPSATTLSSSAADGLTLVLSSAGAVHLRDGAVLLDSTVTSAAGARNTPLVVVDDDTQARLDGTDVDASGTQGAPALAVGPGAVVASVDTRLTGGSGDATALVCEEGTVVVAGGVLRGAAQGATRSTGLSADGCVVVLSGASIEGGVGDVATGLSATTSLVSADADASIVGRTVAGGTGVGASIADDASPAILEGTVSASALVDDAPLVLEEASALVLFGARAELAGARVAAASPGARGIVAAGGALSAAGATVGVAGDGSRAVTLDGGAVAVCTDATLVALGVDAIGVQVSGATAELMLSGVTVSADGAGVSAPDVAVLVLASEVSVSGAGATAAARGLSARAIELFDSSVQVLGDMSIGVESTDASRIERSTVRAGGSACSAIQPAGALDVVSSYIEATGAPFSCVGVLATSGALSLVHATVRADVGVSWESSLVLRNSVLAGAPALSAVGNAPFTEAIGVAFDAQSPLAVTADGALADVSDLEARGCDVCFTVSYAALVDETGHLLPGANPLVDAADPAVSTPLDIDGDARPAGVRPDVGCDER